MAGTVPTRRRTALTTQSNDPGSLKCELDLEPGVMPHLRRDESQT
jgi:hypothetical protein